MTDSNIFSDSFFAMGTRCDVVFTAIEQERAEQMFHLVKTEIESLEQLISRFIHDSAISKLNETKANVWVDVSDELWEILTICYDFYQMSNGAFDITLAPLIYLWRSGEVPSEQAVKEAQKISGFDKLELDFEEQRIKFMKDNVEFDLGAIGKGIALDTLKPILKSHGIENGIVSFGEDSILALGTHPNGEKWPLGIRNNYSVNDFIHVFETSNQIVTTSGSMLVSDEGAVKKHNHILCPATGMAVTEKRTISVKSDSATMGEFISTAFMILPENDRTILAEKFKNIEILEVDYLDDNDFKTKLTIL